MGRIGGRGLDSSSAECFLNSGDDVRLEESLAGWRLSE